MKTLRHHPPQDLCQTSLKLLDKSIHHYFDKAHYWIPDFPESFYQQISKESPKTLNTVLLGGFTRHLFSAPYWPKTNHQIWCVSNTVKKALEELFFLPPNTINVIPRNSLMPPSKEISDLNIYQEWTLVVSGRLSAVKNIEGVIFFAHSLQTQFDLPVKLALIGDFDNEKHDNKGRRSPFDYEKKVHKLIKGLNWNDKPVIYPKKTEQEWINIPGPQKVIISFSTFIGEDFNMSLAQARQNGWPAILSNWGGHRETEGERAYFFPSSWIPQSHTPLEMQRGQSKALASYFLFLFSNPLKIRPHHLPSNKNSKKLCQSQIYRCLLKATEYWGHELLGLSRDQADYFADTEKGAVFFDQYFKIFSGQEELKHEKELKNHLIILPYEQSKILHGPLNKIGAHQIDHKERVQLIYETDIRYKDAILKIQEADQISIAYDGEPAQKMRQWLKVLSQAPINTMT